MADRGRVGSLVVASKITARRNMQRDHDLHRKRITLQRAAIDMAEPHAVGMDHIRNNLKREQLLEERYMEIDRENGLLLRKMSEIMKKPVQLQDNRSGPTSVNKDGRKKELQRITHENGRLLRSITEVKPVYSIARWEKETKERDTYLRNICEFPVSRLAKNRSAPALLMPLGADSQSRLQATGSLSLQDSSERAREEDMRFVLKEGQRLGGTYYLIEMSTDGRTLNVSAYDGDSQTTLELVVKERNHRKLYRDNNGDYSAIAGRLRVENNRLMLS